ncbi:uncharacterized protein JCM6883_005938 [Sporobolomyces salmoneus]|uniref:uncharacterized protein n=1 Tax=Sporobolomyces salmoneus TaxID=183962 RepID=UPI00316E87E0
MLDLRYLYNIGRQADQPESTDEGGLTEVSDNTEDTTEPLLTALDRVGRSFDLHNSLARLDSHSGSTEPTPSTRMDQGHGDCEIQAIPPPPPRSEITYELFEITSHKEVEGSYCLRDEGYHPSSRHLNWVSPLETTISRTESRRDDPLRRRGGRFRVWIRKIVAIYSALALDTLSQIPLQYVDHEESVWIIWRVVTA